MLETPQNPSSASSSIPRIPKNPQESPRIPKNLQKCLEMESRLDFSGGIFAGRSPELVYTHNEEMNQIESNQIKSDDAIAII